LRRADGRFRWVTSSDPKVVTGAPFRTIVDHGIQVGMHGDGVHIAPLNPWAHIYFATTGVNSFGDKVNGDQQITREEALRLFTRGNSWFLRMEDRIGTIENGKLADMSVLNKDYFTVPECGDSPNPLRNDCGRRQNRPRIRHALGKCGVPHQFEVRAMKLPSWNRRGGA
jgi:cytosine/adenosine deaminase-related metal-dependent hydrolase